MGSVLHLSRLFTDGHPTFPCKAVDSCYQPRLTGEYAKSVEDVFAALEKTFTSFFPEGIFSGNSKILNDRVRRLTDNFDFSIPGIVRFKKDGKLISLGKLQGQFYLTVNKIFSALQISLDEKVVAKRSAFLKGEVRDLQRFSKKTGTTALLQLPLDLWNIVFSYTQSYKSWDELVRMAHACHSFHTLLNPFFTQHAFKSNPSLLATVPNSDFARELISFADYTPTHIKEQNGLTDSELKVLGDKGSCLQKITLNGGNYTPQGLAIFLRKCPKLRTIEFINSSLPQFDDYISVIAAHGRQITALKVVDCVHMTDISLFALAAHGNLMAFEYCNSDGSSPLTDYGFITFFEHTRPLLRFSIRGCQLVTQLSLAVLISAEFNKKPKGAELLHLAISQCGTINEELFTTIGDTCKKLHTLELGFSPVGDEVADRAFEENSDGLTYLLSALTHIRSLKIADCNFLSPVALSALINNNRGHFRRLELYRCFHLSEADCFSLSGCRQLQVFNYEPVLALEHQELRAEHITMLERCPILTDISFTRCQISSDCLNGLIVSKAKTLRYFRLFECRTAAPDLLRSLSLCHSLHSLELVTNVAESLGFNEPDLIHLVRKCPELRTLHLKAESTNSTHLRFTYKTLFALALYSNKLKHLTLSHLDLKAVSKGMQTRVNNSLIEFSKHCQRLVHIGFPRSDINVHQMLFLMKRYETQLISLDFSGTSLAINKLIFQSLLRGRIKLQYLHLENTPLSQSVFEQILRNFQALRFLDVRGTHINFSLARQSITSRLTDGRKIHMLLSQKESKESGAGKESKEGKTNL